MRWGFSEVTQELYTTAAEFAEKDRMFADVTELRPDLFRMGIPWSYVAKQKDPTATNARDWSMVDTSINDALLLGSEIVMQVGLYRPSWGSWWGFGGTPGTIADFAAFTTECVNRYKPGGPGIRTDGKYSVNSGRGVSIWECWNEQNNGAFWGRNVSAQDYTDHLHAFYTAVKAIQPSTTSTVLFGGTQHIQRVQGPYPGENTSVMPEITFVKGCIAAGALAYCDAMSVHYYQNIDTVAYLNPLYPAVPDLGPAPSKNSDNWRQLVEIRQQLVDAGHSAMHIWITEVGWSTNQVTPTQQASYMQTLYGWMKDLGYIDAFIVYNVRNDGPSLTDFQMGWGAMDYKFAKKPLWEWLRTLSSPSPPRVTSTALARPPTIVITQPNLTVTPPRASATAQAVVPVTKQAFSIAIPGSGTTIPASFDTFGDGLQLNSGTLTENTHGSNTTGEYRSGFIHNVPCLTFLHRSKVQFGGANGGTTDRSSGCIVGADDPATPLNYVEALACGVNYMGLNMAIKKVVAGVPSAVLVWTNVGLVDGDFLDFVISKPAANYVYSIYKNGSGTASLVWTDTSGNPPPGKYIGGEVLRINAGGVQWGSPGIKGTWIGGDV